MNIQFLHTDLSCLQVMNLIAFIFGFAVLCAFIMVALCETHVWYVNRQRRLKWETLA